METTTTFDLNQAIQRWLDNFAQSPTLQRENLDELEAHLRDSITTLQSRGLSAEEAFFIAARRLGQPAEIAQEFGAVNPGLVWRTRAFWMLAGMLFWILSMDAVRIVKAGAAYAGSWFTQNGLVLGWLGGAVHTLVFVGIIMTFWQLANGCLPGATKVEQQLHRRPVRWFGGFIICLLLLKLLSVFIFALTYKRLEPPVLGQRFLIESGFSTVIALFQTAGIIGGIVWLRREKSGSPIIRTQ